MGTGCELIVNLDREYSIRLERIIDAVKMVAEPYDVQITLFPQNFPIADEIALNFNDEVAFYADYLKKNKLITDMQYDKIIELDDKFAKMSNDKTYDYWSLEALKDCGIWEECRLLAREILKGFKID